MTERPNPYAPPKVPLNPYAPPHARLERTLDAGGGGLWRDGKVLVLRPGGALPPRCVKCNAPAETPVKSRKIYWHRPVIYFFILLNLLIYAIAALIARKQATVSPGLCTEHRKRRQLGLAIGWGGALLGLAMLFGGLAMESGAVAGLGLFPLLGSLIAGPLLARIVVPVRIDTDYVRLKGCGDAFLAGLPTFPG